MNVQFIKENIEPGRIINGLTFINDIPYKTGHRISMFKCICGNYFTSRLYNIKKGIVRSCGCYQKSEEYYKSITKHGHCKDSLNYSPEYKTWNGIKQRCYNPKTIGYRNYGGRGIIVCDRWLSGFKYFFEDMGKRPTGKHSIDRIDVNGNYEPSNCKWSTKYEQERNRRSNVYIEYNGIRLCLKDWGEKLGINRNTLHARLYRLGWSVEESFSIKSKKYRCS